MKIPSEINWSLHISKRYLVKTQKLLEFCSTHYDSRSQRCLLGFATYISERDQFFNLKFTIVILYIFLKIQKWYFITKFYLTSREKKNVLGIEKNFWKYFEITWTIYSNSETFFVLQDRKVKFSACYCWKISWILSKFQLIRTSFIFWSPC